MFSSLLSEISFQTARSGGKGGQHVNKVETAVIASFRVSGSALLSESDQQLVLEKLGHRISREGFLRVKAQSYRSQLENKEDAVQKLEALVRKALEKKRPRIATRMSKAVKERRLESKKIKSERKSGRRKINPGNW